MTELPTLEAALKLADQDCPLPSLAGPALKVLRQRLLERQEDLEFSRRIQADADNHQARVTYNVGACPECGHDAAESLRGWHQQDGKTFRCPACKFVAGCKAWPDNPGSNHDSATLTTLIAELRAREAVGRAKYGTDVDRTDLNNAQWRQHLREELMDALLYSLAEERTAPAKADFTNISLEGKAAWGSLVNDYLAAHSADAQPIQRPDAGSMVELAARGGIRPIRLAEEPTQPVEAGGCWCEVCDPALVGVCMVLCPTCGNKRCPHAHDHRNACTGSNAVGQPGSSCAHVKPLTAPTDKDC